MDANTGDASFYATAAQVIPILMLALFFELRFIDEFLTQPGPPERTTANEAAEKNTRSTDTTRLPFPPPIALMLALIVTATLLAIGEILSLHALATESSGRLQRVTVVGALAISTFLMGGYALLAALEAIHKNFSLRNPRHGIPVMIAAVVGLVAMAAATGVLMVGGMR